MHLKDREEAEGLFRSNSGRLVLVVLGDEGPATDQLVGVVKSLSQVRAAGHPTNRRTTRS